MPAARQPQFDAPALPLHCVLSGSTLSDVKNKLHKTRQIRDAEACALYMTSLFPYLVQLFLASPAPEALLQQWLSALLEKMDEPDNFAAGLPRLLALANMSQEHLTRPQPLLSAVHRALRLSAQGVSRPVPGGRTPRGFIFIIGLFPADFICFIDHSFHYIDAYT